MRAEAIREFVIAPKPEWCKPVDVAIIVFFAAIADDQGNCKPTYEEIAAAIGGGDTGFKAIRNSIDRLRGARLAATDLEWIWRDKGRTGERTHYMILWANLPGAEKVQV
jgi:hypothetical protein